MRVIKFNYFRDVNREGETLPEETSIQGQTNPYQREKLVVAFETWIRRRPFTVNGKEYERFFALIPLRSEASDILNAMFDSLEKKELSDIRVVDGNRIFVIPNEPIHTERTKKDGRRSLRFTIPAEVGRQIVDKNVFVYAYVGEGDGSIKRVDSRVYDAVAVFVALIRLNGSVMATVPVRYSNVIPIGKELEVDVIDKNKIKTMKVLTYKNGSYRGVPIVALRFNKEEAVEFVDKRVFLVVKVI